jgi:uncharacterized protein (DUF1015 family)
VAGHRLQPFRGAVVRQDLAPEVVSPPYDALSPAQRAEHLARHPLSYLGVLQGPDGAPGGDHLAACRRALDRLLAVGAFEPRPEGFVVCRLTQTGHAQTGIVGEVPLAWVDEGRVRYHEQVRDHRVDEILAHLRYLGVTSSPVVLAHRRAPGLGAVVEAAAAGRPLRDFTMGDGLRVQLWELAGRDEAEAVGEALDQAELYITDGHHRVEAARRHRRGIEERPGRHQHVLGALFAEDQLRVEPFHRVVASVGDRFTERLAAAGRLQPTEGPVAPHRQGSFAVAHQRRWWRLDVAAGPDELAPDVLQRAVLGPLLGIADPSRDPRLGVVPGTAAPQEVAEQADAVGGAAFLLHRVSVAQLMVTADQGRTLPPKSTYFVPKMRSGVFLRQG